MEFANIRDLILKAQGVKSSLEKQIEESELQITKKKTYLKNLELAQALLQEVATETQEQLKFHLQDIIQLALDAIFPGQYIFNIEFQIRYGKTEMNLQFLSKNSGLPIDPMEASGGGVVDVCAFALRLAAYSISRGIDNTIIVDEPFRFVSRDLQDQAGLMIKELSEKMKLQIIMITHIQALSDTADKLYRITKDKSGRSNIKLL